MHHLWHEDFPVHWVILRIDVVPLLATGLSVEGRVVRRRAVSNPIFSPLIIEDPLDWSQTPDLIWVVECTDNADSFHALTLSLPVALLVVLVGALQEGPAAVP